MHLDVITPVNKLLSLDVEEIIAPTVQGQITVLPNHISLFTKLAPGELIVKSKNQTSYLAVTGGFLEIHNNQVNLLADYAVRSEEIDTQKAIEAQKRAEEVLKRRGEQVSEKDLAMAQSELRRSILELDIANRRKSQKGRV